MNADEKIERERIWRERRDLSIRPLSDAEEGKIFAILRDQNLSLMRALEEDRIYYREQINLMRAGYRSQVEFIRNLEPKEGVVSVVVRIKMGGLPTKAISPIWVKEVGEMIKEAYGESVLVIMLGEGESVEELDLQEMSLRGWVPAPEEPDDSD